MKSRNGFTLIEIMIVMGILGFLVAFGLPKFRKQQNNIKSVVRQMATLSREIRNQARMKQMTYRLVMRIGEKDAYWVEAASGQILAPSKESLEKLESLGEKERPPDPFQKVTTFFKNEKELPPGLFFGSVETLASEDPVTSGTAYVYFTPEGLVQKAVIQITNRKEMTWTLIFNPMTGHADIVEKPISLKDLKFE